MNRKLGCLLVTVAALALAGVTLVGTGLFPNIGLKIGYYGELNRVLASVRRQPGVSLEKYWANKDVSIEEISLWATVEGRYAVIVHIPETTDHRDVRQIVIATSPEPLPLGQSPELIWTGHRVNLDRFAAASSSGSMDIGNIVRQARALYEFASDAGTPDSTDKHLSVVYVTIAPLKK